ncbi:MAG TPA: LacI family DNA-binding transcriptional regulator [Sphingomicrobium sp.]|jgi:LacI family transcriptional regulator|nr:LacI family DNA-binding transcriptional regulator [Sphingomicrobium sp.]
MKRHSTIDDVARTAGVARVTVSRVLNNGANVRPETRERVRRAVEKLGYSVNQQARALASGMGRQIMLIHAHSPELEPNSYYNAGLELGALRGCSSLAFDLVTRAVDPHDGDRLRHLSAILEREKPAGIILSPPLSDDVVLIETARKSGVQVVAISAGEDARDCVLAVGIDERGAGYAIGRHLALLGHRSLGFIKGPAEHRAARLRYDGFLKALREFGVGEEPWTTSGDFTFRSGSEATERLLQSGVRVTAIACANDDMAAGVMLALHRAGVEIPAAMSVTGFDDTPMSEIVWPPLTTVRQPIKELSERAVHLLVENQSNGHVHYDALPFALVVRESTSSPPEKLSTA